MAKTPAEKANTEVGSTIDYEQYAGAGFENASAEDYAIPYIYIVQKNGRMIDTNKDARPGMLYNNVTGQLYGELIAIPCEFTKEWGEWTPHDEGGGFHGAHPFTDAAIAECVQNDRGRWVTPDGHEMVDTRKHYCIFISPETGEVFPGIIAMTYTQAKKSRRWLTTMANQEIELANGRKIHPATFAFQYRLTTTLEQKDQNSWHGWVIGESEQVTDEDLYHRAHELHKSIKAGEVNEAAQESE